MSKMQIGYDGLAPEFREARDLDGKGKRQAELGPQNIRVDRLEWLLAHKKIELHHHYAGRKLQHDQEQAQIGGYASLQGGLGGSGTTRLSDAKCDAIGRVNAARIYVGNKCWRILELVVIENTSLADAEARMGLTTGNGRGVLLAALDVLSNHYGLA